MSNITYLQAAAGRSPDTASSKPRGKFVATHTRKAAFNRMIEMTQAAGIIPKRVTFGADGSVTFSDEALASTETPDEFSKSEGRL